MSEELKENMLIPAPGSPIVIPSVSAKIALQRWHEYQELEKEILEESDYIFYVTWKNDRGYPEQTAFEARGEADKYALKMHGHVKPRKKKVAFRKLGVFFSLTLPEEIAEGAEIEVQKLDEDHYVTIEKRKGAVRITYMDGQFRVLRTEWDVVVQQVREDGKAFSMAGHGEASNNDKKTLKAHNINSTAFTRALNRGISDLVGFGDVSAEEIQSPEDLDEKGDIVEGEIVKHKEPAPSVRLPVEAGTTESGTTNRIKTESTPEQARAKKLFELAKKVGYPLESVGADKKKTIIATIVHKVNVDKMKFGELDEQEAGLIEHYLLVQEGKTGKEKEKAKDHAVSVIARVRASQEPWDTAWHNTQWVEQVESKEVPDMAKALE